MRTESATAPFLWMGYSVSRGCSAWLEFPATAMGHAALTAVAERLCRDFGAEVIERLPEQPAEDKKEYWRLRLGEAVLMLMRKPPILPVALGVESGDIEALVRIGQAWGVERYVGWPWWIWKAGGRLFGRRG